MHLYNQKHLVQPVKAQEEAWRRELLQESVKCNQGGMRGLLQSIIQTFQPK